MSNKTEHTSRVASQKTGNVVNLDNILFSCRDILRAARNAGSFFEKRDMMLTLIFLRFIGEKYEDGVARLRQQLVNDGLDPDNEEIIKAFFDDATFTDAPTICRPRHAGQRSSTHPRRNSMWHSIPPCTALPQIPSN